MYICLCKGITESDVCELGRAGLVCPDALASALGLDQEGCCGRCFKSIGDLAALALNEHQASVFSPSCDMRNPVSFQET